MSTVRFQVSGRLTAFHASEGAGVVICLPLVAEGTGVGDLGKIGPGMIATVDVEITLPDNIAASEAAEGEAEA